MTVIRQSMTLLIPIWVSCVGLSAQSPEWSIDYGREQAATSTSGIEATWTTDRVETKWSRTGRGGWLFAIERQQRNGLSDVALVSLGYWRAGDWTFSMDGGATPRADFLYRGKAGGEISFRAVGTVVVSGGYHYLRFPSAEIHQVEPALTWYYPRGDVQGRLYITSNATRGRTSTAMLVRSAFDVTPRLRLSGGASIGDRIFDIASLPLVSARTRVGFADMQLGLSGHDFITSRVTAAREDPAFSYISLTLNYRRVF
jgi:YaiO family outer membrane protein